jgi:hypothetical protein
MPRVAFVCRPLAAVLVCTALPTVGGTSDLLAARRRQVPAGWRPRVAQGDPHGMGARFQVCPVVFRADPCRP